MKASKFKHISPVVYLLFLAILGWTSTLYAQAKQDESAIAEFVQAIQTPTYDCPSDQHIDRVNTLLSNLTPDDEFYAQLFLYKTHWMICQGKMREAQQQVKDWLDSEKHGKNSYSYAMAQYQIGFVHDVNEEAQRCEYYQNALDASQVRRDTVFLSASLGLITACDKGEVSTEDKLANLFALLEKFVSTGDKGAIAHIHNNIGLFYGSIGQNVLAAEQYQKAYELGLSVYDKKNQLPTLISAIASNSVVGDFERVETLLSELRQANNEVNTPWSNLTYNYLLARFLSKTQQFTELKEVLPRLKYYLAQSPHRQIQAKYEWMLAQICSVEGNMPCVQSFTDQESTRLEGKPAWPLGNTDYLKMMVEFHLLLGNMPSARTYFARYVKEIEQHMRDTQSSGRIIGSANLKAAITRLETDLQQEQQRRLQFALWLIVALLALGALVAWVVTVMYRKKNLRDPLTGLLHHKAILRAIKKLPCADNGRTNALAVFDLADFKQVKQQFGHMSGDLVLQHVSSTLKHSVRKIDLVGRLQSRQFVVCVANVEESIAKGLFERIQRELNETVFSSTNGETMDVKSAMSIYFTPDTFDDLQEVLEDMQNSQQGQANDAAIST